MVDNPNPYEASHSSLRFGPTQKGASVFTNWFVFYVTLIVFLGLTAPATSHSDNWAGIVPAICIMLFGAYRLARAGVKASTAFVYGCSTTPLFLCRFLSMGRFSLWLHYQSPSTTVLVVVWIAISMFLGCAAFAIAYIANDASRRGEHNL